MSRRLMLKLLFFFAGWSASAVAGASDLTIGIGADVTAIDPHYHNVTPNNNVAAHIFDYLVLRDERQKPIPGLASTGQARGDRPPEPASRLDALVKDPACRLDWQFRVWRVSRSCAWWRGCGGACAP